MDPVTALSLACNVLQLIEIGSKLVSTFSQLSRSEDEAINSNAELEIVAKDLVQLNDRLNSESTVEVSSHLATLCRSCNVLTTDLLNTLDKLKTRGNRRPWILLWKSWKTVLNENKISDLQTRISNLREQLSFHLLVDLRNQLLSLKQETLESFKSRDPAYNRLINNLVERQDAFQGVSDLPIKEEIVPNAVFSGTFVSSPAVGVATGGSHISGGSVTIHDYHSSST